MKGCGTLEEKNFLHTPIWDSRKGERGEEEVRYAGGAGEGVAKGSQTEREESRKKQDGNLFTQVLD